MSEVSITQLYSGTLDGQEETILITEKTKKKEIVCDIFQFYTHTMKRKLKIVLKKKTICFSSYLKCVFFLKIFNFEIYIWIHLLYLFATINFKRLKFSRENK